MEKLLRDNDESIKEYDALVRRAVRMMDLLFPVVGFVAFAMGFSIGLFL